VEQELESLRLAAVERVDLEQRLLIQSQAAQVIRSQLELVDLVQY
jgi:hypothetical protein